MTKQAYASKAPVPAPGAPTGLLDEGYPDWPAGWAWPGPPWPPGWDADLYDDYLNEKYSLRKFENVFDSEINELFFIKSNSIISEDSIIAGHIDSIYATTDFLKKYNLNGDYLGEINLSVIGDDDWNRPISVINCVCYNTDDKNIYVSYIYRTKLSGNYPFTQNPPAPYSQPNSSYPGQHGIFWNGTNWDAYGDFPGPLITGVYPLIDVENIRLAEQHPIAPVRDEEGEQHRVQGITLAGQASAHLIARDNPPVDFWHIVEKDIYSSSEEPLWYFRLIERDGFGLYEPGEICFDFPVDKIAGIVVPNAESYSEYLTFLQSIPVEDMGINSLTGLPYTVADFAPFQTYAPNLIKKGTYYWDSVNAIKEFILNPGVKIKYFDNKFYTSVSVDAGNSGNYITIIQNGYPYYVDAPIGLDASLISRNFTVNPETNVMYCILKNGDIIKFDIGNSTYNEVCSLGCSVRADIIFIENYLYVYYDNKFYRVNLIDNSIKIFESDIFYFLDAYGYFCLDYDTENKIFYYGVGTGWGSASKEYIDNNLIDV